MAEHDARTSEFNLRERADAIASAYPPLLIAAERIAVSVIHGVHGRRRSGPGEDFWQYRSYSPGDAASRIDWRKSARSGRILIRENEWAATNTLYVWVSDEPGMGFRSDLADTTKHERAALVALALAAMAVRAGERVAALGTPWPPGHTALALRRIAAHLAQGPHGGDGLPPDQELPRFASLLLVGDLLAPLEAIAARAGALAGRGARGHMVQVLDPAEETLPYAGRTEFREFAGSARLIAGRAESLRGAYARRLADHRAGLADLARRLGWTFTVHRTDRPLHPLMLALYGLIGDDFVAAGRAASV